MHTPSSIIITPSSNYFYIVTTAYMNYACFKSIHLDLLIFSNELQLCMFLTNYACFKRIMHLLIRINPKHVSNESIKIKSE